MNREFELAVTDHLLSLVEARTSDLAPTAYEVPVEVYVDEEHARRERQVLFRGTPVLAALSCELPEPGDFKALSLVSTPLLLIRDDAGEVGAFFNACRHRGMKLTAEGRGSAERMVCPYHAWAYTRAGALAGVPRGPQGFPGLCREERGLTPVPVAERHGMIWVRIDGDEPIDIDSFLGDFGPELARWRMETWHYQDSKVHESKANWKLALEGFTENYHVEFLHKGTLDQIAKSYGLSHQAFGDHQRMGYPNHPIDRLREQPREQWEPLKVGAISFIMHLFPNTIMALFYDHFEIFQILPGPTADRSITVQSFYTPEAVGDEDREELLGRFQFVYNLLQAEDYWAIQQTQQTLSTGANKTLVFGRQEIPLHQLHDSCAKHLAGGLA
ncbi:MAG TPA: aromatic ring-hydroxylating dioxygenase subunit alpha [Pseudonocardia sp.]|jgi:phenylpropionate dioxygenase-like ring-hydroxylating dioxygenase large terminal subunit